MCSFLAIATRSIEQAMHAVSIAVFAVPRSCPHTAFDFSVPSDGAAVGESLSEVTVAFTEPVTSVGDGFEALDPQNNLLTPVAVTAD